jgi:Holliday junction DNA helicase RuvB
MSGDPFRVTDWDDYRGQAKMKERLSVQIDSALDRCESLDHVLLIGPPGCGKTTIAQIIAAQMCTEYEELIMPQKPAVLRRILESHEGVLLLDEIHRLKTADQERFLPVIEDGYWQMDNGVKLEINPNLTIIGATTEPDQIVGPLYDRFTIKPSWDPYTDRDMAHIVRGMAERTDTHLSRRSSRKLARATGGVPRNAKALVKMARDLYTDNVDEILRMCRLTPEGLTVDHVRYLRVLKQCGKPTGLSTISAHLRLPPAIIVELERLLINRELISYETNGRDLCGKAYKVIKEAEEL